LAWRPLAFRRQGGLSIFGAALARPAILPSWRTTGNYPQVKMPGFNERCRAGRVMAVAHAEEFGGDRERLYLMDTRPVRRWPRS